MRTLLANKEKHYRNFADTVNQQYRQMRYGIGSYEKDKAFELASLRKELVDWQANEDAEALSQTNVNYQTWLAVSYDDMYHKNGGTGYINTNTPIGAQKVGLNYHYGNGGNLSQNIVEVNAGGCITRINLNPSITINQNSSFIFSQDTPSNIWDIQHNLGLVPNVFMEDESGVDIQGNVQVIDQFRIKIFFNQPVAGKAFLS